MVKNNTISDGKVIRLRRYRFTTHGDKSMLLNKYNTDYEANFKKWNSMTYLCFQCEIGKDTGKFHLQGYMEFKNGVAIKTIKKKFCKIANLNIERLKGTAEQNRNYCSKLDTKVLEYDFKEFGEIKQTAGKRTDWDIIKKNIDNGMSYDEIAEANPTKAIIYDKNIKRYIYHRLKKENQEFKQVEVRIYYGRAGTGKTKKVVDEFGNENIYRLSRGDNGGVWFDGYTGQKVLLIDDFNGWIRRGRLLELLDGYAFQLQVKGSFTWKCWDTVIITSNYDVKDWYNNDITKDEGFRRRLKYVEYFENNEEIYIPTWEELLQRGREAKKNKKNNTGGDIKTNGKDIKKVQPVEFLKNYTEVRGNTGDFQLCKISPEPLKDVEVGFNNDINSKCIEEDRVLGNVMDYDVDSEDDIKLCNDDNCECLDNKCINFKKNLVSINEIRDCDLMICDCKKCCDKEEIRSHLIGERRPKDDREEGLSNAVFGKEVLGNGVLGNGVFGNEVLGNGIWDNGLEDEKNEDNVMDYNQNKINNIKSLVDRLDDDSEKWFDDDYDDDKEVVGIKNNIENLEPINNQNKNKGFNISFD